MANRYEPQLLSVQRVLTDGMYSIPAYQRNYAWGVTEIRLLIEDIRDYTKRHSLQKIHDYYIGTLVVYERHTEKSQHWEVVDGQQRLTTLSLLVSLLRALHPELAECIPHMPLQFECRVASSQALQAVFAQPLKAGDLAATEHGNSEVVSAEDAGGASSIWAGCRIIESLLREMPYDERKAFAQFLLHHVQLLRVELPPRTDLNHYFECMNNRGEQLAKHEVLKARLLGVLHQCGDQIAMQMLQTVWDACAVMDRSVQSGFAPALRKKLFRADGRTLLTKDLNDLLECFGTEGAHVTTPRSLTHLIAAESTRVTNSKPANIEAMDDDDEDEAKAQFGAVINFPNFLLQVLAMMPGGAFVDTPLDDKHLLTAFEPLLRCNAAQIREFGFTLLRCRFLLDQHVIQGSLDSQGDNEHWQLRRCKFRNDKAALQWVNAFDAEEQDLSERLRMLQAALHVSYMLPTRKHWLQGVLRWLNRQKITEAVDAQAFLLALEELAKAFVLEVGSCVDVAVSYEAVVRREPHFFVPQKESSALVQALPKKLVYGRARLIDFNFLDYLLWLQGKGQSTTEAQEWRDFVFTSSRRSVEHLHPQTELYTGNAWNDEHLHAFGNLCLVSHAMNSRLGNSGPEDKYKQLMSERQSLSLKIFSMHRCFERNNAWSVEHSMACHAAQMLSLLGQAFATSDLSEICEGEILFPA